ncbi:MAG TPA: N-acetylmuramoyl-L-alanine amidase [Acidimicrobiales bacterium]|nr:N-acetylmuramoyl-L-alanine amidase [Acidimicrobiales bacterium]
MRSRSVGRPGMAHRRWLGLASVAVVVATLAGTTAAAAPTRRAAGAAAGAAAGVAAAEGPDGPEGSVATSPPDPSSAYPVVGMAADPAAAGGYWVVAANGGVFAFSAPFSGSAGGLSLNRPIVGIAATPDGRGYWLVASDGGIFSYGDAAFSGSAGGLSLNKPIVGMAATPDGRGYWLVASDGGIFSYGDAAFEGSAAYGSTPLARPIVGMAATPDGDGYWLVAADGGIFSYGDAAFAGSTGGMVLGRAVVGMAASTAGTGSGYWLAGGDGGVYAFGDAAFAGSVHVLALAGLVVALDPGHDGGNGGAPQVIDRPIDGGGFTEPCDTVGAATDAGYPEHAFNFDVATRAATLLEAEGADVVLTRSTDTGVGPCVDVRAAIGNDAHAAAAVSIHADGGPPGGRGFTVITPAPVVSPISDNTAIVAPSDVLGTDVRNAFAATTGEPTSTYDGTDGLIARGDLGGLTLSTVPKVLIECANMRNATDAALVSTAGWRQQAAQGIADGVTGFLVAEQQT